MVIKITEEMFDDVVKKAMHRFNEVGIKEEDKEDHKKMMVNFMMGMQNAVFASMLREELFNTKEEI